ncbi:MAG: flagellar hook-associated protein 3 [Leptospiraceae bacterium]|nr:flagellar hook-associated protein 3 [Leptospiraceae bacterium]
MRITNQMTNNTLVRNLNRQQEDLDNVQNQLGTGIKISKPSDEPGIATNQIYFKTRLHELDQFGKNLEDGKARLNTIDGALSSVTDLLQRVRVLTVQGANGIYQGDKGFELEFAIAKEIDEHLRALVDIANSRDATGQYIFGGFSIDRAPFEAFETKEKGLKGLATKEQIVGVEYRGDNGEQLREIEKGEYIGVTIPGNKVFWGTNTTLTSSVDATDYVAQSPQKIRIDGVEISIGAGDRLDDIIDKINTSPISVKAVKLGNNNLSLNSTSPHQIWLEDFEGGTVLRDLGLVEANSSEPPGNYSRSATVTGLSIFDVLIQLRNDLTAKDQERVGGKDLGDIDSALENILRYRAEVGAKVNRVENHAQRVAFESSFTTELLAKNEAIDFPETIMHMKWLESVHSYALNVGSRIIKPTLLDFLR